MFFPIDTNGFLSSAQNAVTTIEIEPPSHLVIPRWVNGEWQEGLVRRGHLLDELGFYVGTQPEIDPRMEVNFTTVAIPEHLILPRFVNGVWSEGILHFVAVIDDDGFFVSMQQNVDPRNATANYITSFPPAGSIVPRYQDGQWIDIGLKSVVVLDAQGYITGHAENIDPRHFGEFFTTIFPEQNFVVPRFENNTWIESGVRRAWQIDDNGFFVADMYDFDPRTTESIYTEVPLHSGVFRKPRFMDGTWIESDPVLPSELLAIAKASKQAEIANQLSLELAAGVPFLFGENPDVIQTRFERDLINISGITVRAIILNSQGVSDAVIEFRAESNQTYMITPQQAIALGEAVADHSSQAYAKSWAAKDALELATTVEDVEAITYGNSGQVINV